MARILVIDDDDLLNDMIQQLLLDAGYEAEGALDGAIGLKLLEGKPFDLVITDIVMPGTEGIETIRHIREKNKTIPIIACSGDCRYPELYLKTAGMLGANYMFKKPFENHRLLDAVRDCLTSTDKRSPGGRSGV